jgi:hypothetical protein
MKPLAWAASPPPLRALRDDRPRLPAVPVRVLLTVSSSAPEPDVRLLFSLYARVLLRVAMAAPTRISEAYPGHMASLIRMDRTGHTTLAEWTAEDDAAFEAAVREFGDQQALGYIGTVPDGPGKATHVRELPRDADMVILRRPIAGG